MAHGSTVNSKSDVNSEWRINAIRAFNDLMKQATENRGGWYGTVGITLTIEDSTITLMREQKERMHRPVR